MRSARPSMPTMNACRTNCWPSSLLTPGLPWNRVPGWLAGAAVVIVPSLAETFGLVALEAMAAATPVIAFDLDNLPALIGGGGSLITREQGHLGLWRAAEDVLGAPLRYAQASRAASDHAQDYRPAPVAELLVKVVG